MADGQTEMMEEMNVGISQADFATAGDQDQGEFVVKKTTSEVQSEVTHGRIDDYLGEVTARWQKREREEGTVMYASPFERGVNRKLFPTEDEAMRHTREHYPAQCELAETEGREVQAKEVIVPPKRKLSDFLPAEYAERIEKAHEAARAVQPLMQHIQRAGRDGRQKIQSLAFGPESTAIQAVPKLSDSELEQLGRKAHFSGKTLLTRACRRELTKRNIRLGW